MSLSQSTFCECGHDRSEHGPDGYDTGCNHGDDCSCPFFCSVGPPPARGRLLPEVEQAARLISRDAWGSPYKPGKGVMHYGTGPAHRGDLLKKAARWEAMAEAARICARTLPDG